MRPAGGIATFRLEGTRFSDWDLAVFGSGGRLLGASTSFGAAENALARVDAGEDVLVQACRRLGADASVPLSIGFDAVPRGGGEPAQLVEVGVRDAADVRRLEATGLDVTHDVEPGRASVVVYSAAERARLDALGLATRTAIPDLAAEDATDRQREARAGRSSARALPSGRTTYRQPQDYTSEMKALAERSPALVRKVTLPLASLEGRPIEGVEIATNVGRTDDGRPVYLQMGAHHAREWPSAELPMEFALDLVRRFNAGDARIRSLLGRVRVIVVPVVNVDGFAVSRSAGQLPGNADDDSNVTLGLALNDQAAYKRKNCRPTVPAQAAQPCATRTNSGVDLNRNYGAYWGGPGSSNDPTTQGFRGPSPYSEPESEAVHRFTANRHVVTFITNHTFTEDGKFLRQPGFDDVIRVTPDEAPMKALGDSMAAATGWTSELGYATLGDITGATEDWNYFAQGTFGYTPEARGTNFHANYADSVVREYDGTDSAGRGGIAEAFVRAGEQAASPAGHSIVTGTAPARRVLRLRKRFSTATSQSGLSVADTLDTTLTVPAGGRYEWHVNPSKRPLFANSSEAWTMTCESSSGRVLGSALVDVARGARAGQGFSCDGTGSAPGEFASAVPGCGTATGRVTAKGLERARLGRKRSTVRRAFARGRRTKGPIDRFCLVGGGSVRVGYPSAGLRRELSRRERARVRGRALLLLSSGPRTRLRGVAAGAATRTLARRIGRVKPIRVGSTRWYLRGGKGGRHVFRVTGGKVREVGLADARQTASRARAKRLFASFR